jgi:putative ABC transport system ATP-binding protein
MAPVVLELRHLVKHYRVGDGDPIHAVDGVCMSVAAGEFVALYGPSGSGKTTLLQMIAGLTRPDSGTVVVAGREVSGMSLRESDEYRLRHLGIVGQPQNLIPGARAIENASLKLWLSNKRGARQAIEPLLERLGLGERMEHRTEQLSMGERQRVLIAMALATDPKLVLADEPTGTLDTQRTREVLGLLRGLCRERGAAVVLATHDPQAAGFADQVHELRDGRLQAYVPDAGHTGGRPSPPDRPGGPTHTDGPDAGAAHPAPPHPADQADLGNAGHPSAPPRELV